MKLLKKKKLKLLKKFLKKLLMKMTNAVICFIEEMGEGVCVKAAYYNKFLMKNQYVKTVKS